MRARGDSFFHMLFFLDFILFRCLSDVLINQNFAHLVRTLISERFTGWHNFFRICVNFLCLPSV